jgi:hypothetical protein
MFCGKILIHLAQVSGNDEKNVNSKNVHGSSPSLSDVITSLDYVSAGLRCADAEKWKKTV